MSDSAPPTLNQIDPGGLAGKARVIIPTLAGLPGDINNRQNHHVAGADLQTVPLNLPGAAAAIDVDAALNRCTVTVDDFMGVSFPVRNPIIGTWFYEGDLGYMFADRGVGKTMLALTLASLATKGGEFGPWKAPGGIPTIYVDGEMQNELTKERLRELGMLNNANLYLLHHELAFNYENGLTLNVANPMFQDALIRLVETRQARLLILDNLSCLLGSLVENRSEEWEPVSQWLLHLRRRGVAVIILHHTSRLGNMRGTYKREDSATWVMKLTAITNPGEVNAAAHFKTTFTKFRRGTTREAVALDWHFVRHFGKPTEILVTGISLLGEFVSLVKEGFDSCRGIAPILEISPASVVRLAKDASATGSIRIVKGKYLPPS
jgi:hypothetical protein